jgi:hypothetical protein
MANDLMQKYARMLAEKGAPPEIVERIRTHNPTIGGSLKQMVQDPVFAAWLALATGGIGSAAPGAASSTNFLSKLLGGVDGGDILSAVGAGVGGYMDSQSAGRAIAEQKRQFDLGLGQRQSEAGTAADQWAKQFGEAQRVGDRDFLEDQTRFARTQGNTDAQLAVQAETALNKAPTADKAQALLLSRMGVAPERFQPRDITRGVQQFRAGPTGGVGNVQAAAQKAAAGYKPGQGGVDTSALQLLKQRMLAGSTPAQPPTVGIPRGAPIARRPQVQMLPQTVEPDPQELIRRAPAQGIARRPMAFR